MSFKPKSTKAQKPYDTKAAASDISKVAETSARSKKVKQPEDGMKTTTASKKSETKSDAEASAGAESEKKPEDEPHVDGRSSFSTSAIPDTLDARFVLRKLQEPPPSQPSTGSSSSQQVGGDDGPLLLTLLLTNQNQNLNPDPFESKPVDNSAAPVPDSLDTRQAVSEVLPPSKRKSTSEPANGDGALFLALLMGNNNNNANAAKQPDPRPVPDTLDSRLAVYELMPPKEPGSLDSPLAVTELTGLHQPAAPPVLRLRGAAQKWVPDTTQMQFWKDNGYLVVPDMLSQETVTELLKCVIDSAEAIATGGPGVRRQEFSQWDKGCVNPNGRVIAALTEQAFKPNATPLQYIQRLGCGIHRVLPPFRRGIMSDQNVAIAQALGYKDPRVVQSLVVVKAAHVGTKVIPHQDGCTSFTDPPSNTTFWYALEDANKENGCLAVAPGSHRVTPISKRCRVDEKGLPVFEMLEVPISAHVEGVSDCAAAPERTENGDFVFKELEVTAGSVVLMHANLMHTSAANQSEKSRVAFHFGLVEGGLEWKEDNYLQPADGETEFERLHAC